METISGMHSNLIKLDQQKNKADFIVAFIDMCRKIIGHINAGKLSRQEGCYAIAGLMFMETISKDSRMEDICLLAAELELPDDHISGSISEKWQELARLVNGLA